MNTVRVCASVRGAITRGQCGESGRAGCGDPQQGRGRRPGQNLQSSTRDWKPILGFVNHDPQLTRRTTQAGQQWPSCDAARILKIALAICLAASRCGFDSFVAARDWLRKRPAGVAHSGKRPASTCPKSSRPHDFKLRLGATRAGAQAPISYRRCRENRDSARKLFSAAGVSYSRQADYG